MIFISIHCGHNATVGLSINGKLVSVISEERITRIKNFEGFPIESLRFLKSFYLKNSFDEVSKFVFIDETGETFNFLQNKINNQKKRITNSDNKRDKIKNIIIYYSLPTKLVNLISKIKRKISKSILKIKTNKYKILDNIFNLYPDILFDKNKSVFYNHHEMHALSFRYYFSEFKKENLIFTMDGEGDNLSSTVSTFKDDKITKISENSNNCSIGYLYSQTTEYLGLKPYEHEFKVMGMAPYGKREDVERIYSKIKYLIELDEKGNFKSYVVSSLFKYELERHFHNEKFQNICGAIQKMTENLILDWIKFWIKKKSINNLIVSGGVFMNIKACKEILDLTEVNSLFVVPSATDESLVFGALWKINLKENLKTFRVDNLYLGRNFDSESDIFIKNKKVDKKYEFLKFENSQKLNFYVAELLSKNKIIGRCSGREEWGARALGNRSIICNPSKLENVRLINSTIKERDFWMPFSPTILDKNELKYLKNKKKFSAYFMTTLFDSTEIAKKDLVCAIHPIDFTLRPQILLEKHNPTYYDLIVQFEKKTGIGAVLNTSFNLHGFPNVSTYEDAYKTFENSNLEYLIIENYLIRKTN